MVHTTNVRRYAVFLPGTGESLSFIDLAADNIRVFSIGFGAAFSFLSAVVAIITLF